MSRTAWVAPLAVLVAIGVIVALAFYVRGFQGTGNDHVLLPTDSAPAGASGSSTSAHKHKHKHKHGKKHGKHGHKITVPGGGPTVTLGSGGGGLHLTGNVHRLVVRVHSKEPIRTTIGYFVPTSPDIPYGKAKNVGNSWTVRTTVTGKPHYAIIWIYGAKDGTPVTCSLTLDGQLAVRKTTVGPYGRQICYA
jgi:hypothetical protein